MTERRSNVWIVTKGRWTQNQLNRVVENYHRMVGRTFDGQKVMRAGRPSNQERSSHEVTVMTVVEALEQSGFDVAAVDTEET